MSLNLKFSKIKKNKKIKITLVTKVGFNELFHKFVIYEHFLYVFTTFDIFCVIHIFQEEGIRFKYSDSKTDKPTINYMDRWIISFTQSLLKYVREEMGGMYMQKFKINIQVQ